MTERSQLSSTELIFAANTAGLTSGDAGLNAKLTASNDSIIFSGHNGSGSTEITLSGFKVSSEPTDDDHPASKSYVDKRAAGLDPKQSVQVSTTNDLTVNFSGSTNQTFIYASEY